MAERLSEGFWFYQASLSRGRTDGLFYPLAP